jgi:hypothetical protein
MTLSVRPFSPTTLPAQNDSFVKYEGVGLQLPPIQNKTEPNLRILAHSKGAISKHYLQVSRTWDMANRTTREKILVDFIQRNQGKTGPQLELELGNGASLFLTRISAWLRLTYLMGTNISLQIRAVSVFIGASGGHRFLAEFLEVGGVLTVLEILGLSQVSDVLHFLTSSPRKQMRFVF